MGSNKKKSKKKQQQQQQSSQPNKKQTQKQNNSSIVKPKLPQSQSPSGQLEGNDLNKTQQNTSSTKKSWHRLSLLQNPPSSSSTSSTPTIDKDHPMKHDSHVLILNSYDADLCNLSHGDLVFVVSVVPPPPSPTTEDNITTNSGKIRAHHQKQIITNNRKHAVCVVHIQKKSDGVSTTTTRFASPSHQQSQSKKKSNIIKQGSARLLPKQLHWHFFSTFDKSDVKEKNGSIEKIMENDLCNNKNNNDFMTPTKKKLTNNNTTPGIVDSSVNQTPSSSSTPSKKSSFSFARGGGGDLLTVASPTNPSNNSQSSSTPKNSTTTTIATPTILTPNNKNTENNHNKQEIIIIPLKQNCANVSLENDFNNFTKSSSSSLPIIQFISSLFTSPHQNQRASWLLLEPFLTTTSEYTSSVMINKTSSTFNNANHQYYSNENEQENKINSILLRMNDKKGGGGRKTHQKNFHREKSSIALLRRLGVASLNGVYLETGNIVMIPFQGIKYLFRIVYITQQNNYSSNDDGDDEEELNNVQDSDSLFFDFHNDGKQEINKLTHSFSLLKLFDHEQQKQQQQQQQQYHHQQQQKLTKNHDTGESDTNDDESWITQQLSHLNYNMSTNNTTASTTTRDHGSQGIIPLYRITHDTKIVFIPNQNNSNNSSPELLGSDNKPLFSPLTKSSELTTTPVQYHQDQDNKKSDDNKQQQQQEIKPSGVSDIIQKILDAIQIPLFQSHLFSPFPQQQQQTSSSLALAKPPKGLLLFGPSGCGKTLIAKHLLSLFSSSSFGDNNKKENKNQRLQKDRINVQYVSSHTLISSSYIGENERHISKLFNTSKNDNKNKLLIIDDIHLLCPRRGGYNANSSSTDQLASTLLSLMDGIDSSHQVDLINNNNRSFVFVIGITRSPSDLDPAVRRPGRFDMEIEIPIPDDLARMEIIKNQVSYYYPSSSSMSDIFNEKEYLELSKFAKGFTGADTLLAIKEAIRQTILINNGVKNRKNKEETMIDNHFKQFPPLLSIDVFKNAIRQIPPSSLRTSPQALVEIPQVSWNDIGGMHTCKQLLKEAISLPLENPQIFQRLNIKPPKGILLYGPPGTGKTQLARALATESKMNFIAIKGPELLSKWLGESERQLASLFRKARQASPCVVFFDEVDAIACKRGSGGEGSGSSSSERILSQLLTELDGIQSSSSISSSSFENDSSRKNRVVVVGATNRPDLLDGALMRPGRIDRKIYVGVPDAKSRESILRLRLLLTKEGQNQSKQHKKRCADDVDIEALSRDNITGGFSGAELVAICREAALYAIEEHEENEDMASTSTSNLPLIHMKHLLKSVQNVKKQITPEMLQFYARFQRNELSTQ